MGKLIKLKHFTDKRELWINPAHIQRMERTGEKETAVFLFGEKNPFVAEQTPEEINDLIEQS